MRKLLFVLMPFTASLCLLAMSCSKEDKQCITCKDEKPITKKKVEIQFNGRVFSIEDVPIWRKTAYGGIHYGDQRLANSQFDQINSAINKATTPEVIVFYFNKELIANSSFASNDIKAISTFKVDKNMVFHSFYKNVNGHFEVDPFLTIHTNAISINAILDINNKILQSSQSSILLVDKKPKDDFKPKNKVDVLSKVVNHYEEIKNTANKRAARASSLFKKTADGDLNLEDIIVLLSVQYAETQSSCGG